MKQEVDFTMLDFQEYLSLEESILDLQQLQANDETYMKSRNAEIDESVSELIEYRNNFILFFETISKNNGRGFAIKTHFTLKDIRKAAEVDLDDLDLDIGSCLSSDYEMEPLDIEEIDVPGTCWRFNIDDYVTISDNVISTDHPFLPGDRVQIVNLLDDYQYEVCNAIGEDDNTYEINDEELD